jgi:hypothetical protein
VPEKTGKIRDSWVPLREEEYKKNSPKNIKRAS